jgi:predicted transcriptional regulator
MKTKKQNDDYVVYSCRISREVFEQVKAWAEERDLSASYVIRRALKRLVNSESARAGSPLEALK